MTMEKTLTPLEMILNIKQWGYIPQAAVKGIREFDNSLTAIEIGKLLMEKRVYPEIKKNEMRSALIVNGFSNEEVEQGVRRLYPEWTRIPSMPIARRAAAAGVVDGLIYVFGGGGGSINSDRQSRTVQQYNPLTKEWSLLLEMPFLRSALNSAAVVENNLYIIGGKNFSVDTNQNWRFNPAESSWERMADMPTERARIVHAVVGEKIHVIGGTVAGTPCTHHEVYDVSSDKWEVYPRIPFSCEYLTSAVIGSNIHVLFGGLKSKHFVFDTVTNIWSELAQSPISVFGAAAVGIKGKIYFLGGVDVMLVCHDTTQVYDTETNSWTISPAKLSLPRTDFSAVGIDDTIYALGGFKAGTKFSYDIAEELLV